MTIEKFKQALGKTCNFMTDAEILNLMTALDHLSDYWLDIQETKIFGKPIKNLLDQ